MTGHYLSFFIAGEMHLPCSFYISMLDKLLSKRYLAFFIGRE